MSVRACIAAYRESPLAAEIALKDIVLTITSGRSGTRLLAQLCAEVLALDAVHEPEPRANLALRPALQDRNYAFRWLVEEKLPAIAARPGNGTYVETSHLYGKGFIEPLLALGVRPRFLILRFDPVAVARSLYALGGIPERSIPGKQVLVGPSDEDPLLPLPRWQSYSDYQLCYWYAREIAARQDAYGSRFERDGVRHFWCDLADLIDWDRFANVATFLTERAPPQERRSAFDEITGSNQNPKQRLLRGLPEREMPTDLAAQEVAVDEALRQRSVEGVPRAPSK